MLRESIQEETIPLKHRISKNKWMTDEIKKIMDQRIKKKQGHEEYDRLHIEILNKCEDAK